MSRFAAPIAESIWDMKYRFKEADGKPIDLTVEDSWRRIARDLAKVEKDPEVWENKFYSALEDFKYLPAGRITAGAGTARNVTLFNCFVMGTIPDSMGGIFDMLKEAALTMQQGGAASVMTFSTIRPRGADVKGRCGGCLGAAELHGCLGRDVPHDHVRGLAPWRDDGDDALRSPGYRGFHHRQIRPGPPAHVQHVGAGDGCVHGGRQGGRPLGVEVFDGQGLSHR